jgi:hypothetical protein
MERASRRESIMDKERDNYASYLLRLRRSDRDGQPTWRASLESTRDGQRMEFASVEALVAFLIARFGSMPGGAAGKDGEKQDLETGQTTR